VLHELPLERRTLHGHFSCELEPVLSIQAGDSVAFATLDSGWGIEQLHEDGTTRRRFEPRDPELDEGHALVGPIQVLGARAGQTLAVRTDEIRVGPYGFTMAGGFSTALNERLGVVEGECVRLRWDLDADAGSGRDQHGRTVSLAPFLGVIGQPPPGPGRHPTAPPRIWGGNLDCSELVEGTTLFLPIPVDGALLSLGDGHARQGDGEVSQLAIEAPFERVRVTVDVREDLPLTAPLARTADAWLAFGLDEDLDEAAARALDAMLDLMSREHGFSRADALALASVVVDLRVTQLVNGVRGVHAILRDDAIR
jgi:acetamidase/formamidase